MKQAGEADQLPENFGRTFAGVEAETTIKLDHWEPNADLSDEAFAFHPPADAEEVASFRELVFGMFKPEGDSHD
jgi:hypothetical protein